MQPKYLIKLTYNICYKESSKIITQVHPYQLNTLLCWNNRIIYIVFVICNMNISTIIYN